MSWSMTVFTTKVLENHDIDSIFASMVDCSVKHTKDSKFWSVSSMVKGVSYMSIDIAYQDFDYDPEDIEPAERMLGKYPSSMLSIHRSTDEIGLKLVIDFIEKFPYECVIYDAIDSYKYKTDFSSREEWETFLKSF